jgi:hemoglobin
MTELSEDQVYGVIGEDGFTRLVSAFYRQVPADDILGPMYPPEALAGAESRLRGFLIGRFGGPQTYVEERGHPKLRMKHAPFALTPAARDRWIALMGNALNEVTFPAAVDALLRGFFAQTATFLINHP